MNEEQNIKVKLDPYNGDFVIEAPDRDLIRVEGWVWSVISEQVNKGTVEIHQP
jgi:hypothetical protein